MDLKAADSQCSHSPQHDVIILNSQSVKVSATGEAASTTEWGLEQLDPLLSQLLEDGIRAFDIADAGKAQGPTNPSSSHVSHSDAGSLPQEPWMYSCSQSDVTVGSYSTCASDIGHAARLDIDLPMQHEPRLNPSPRPSYMEIAPGFAGGPPPQHLPGMFPSGCETRRGSCSGSTHQNPHNPPISAIPVGRPSAANSSDADVPRRPELGHDMLGACPCVAPQAPCVQSVGCQPYGGIGLSPVAYPALGIDMLPPWHSNFVTERLRFILLPKREFHWTLGPHALCFEKLCYSTAEVLFASLVQMLGDEVEARGTEASLYWAPVMTEPTESEHFISESKMITRRAVQDLPTVLLHPKDPFWVRMILNDFREEQHVRAFSDYCQTYDINETFDTLNNIFSSMMDIAELLARRNQDILAFQVNMQFDGLRELLVAKVNDRTASASITNACQAAVQHLIKSYDLFTHSFMYAIVIILHPRLKTTYLRAHGWDEHKAQSLVDYCWQIWDSSYRKLDRKGARIASLAENTERDWKTDAFEAYISSDIDPCCLDPLQYWDRRKNCGLDVGLCQMALDYLSIPATTNATEDGLSVLSRELGAGSIEIDDEDLVAKTLLWNAIVLMQTLKNTAEFIRYLVMGI
ncbi:hypothetical protein SISSUDRAFT_1066050 [Sistotremastrum suecicum HHB10207 ss-3]|uniref:Uncharacterized protein n=1 Tax=Sistotremastrum suecicum HHB10207 ss-3 TaxID=1314776 RepID=A0A165YSR3_9AGAM|nr:hypothetical protein SISSUDRAFT_1066050 [Sistotremastrum suecicum HHB10207 ss-3]